MTDADLLRDALRPRLAEHDAQLLLEALRRHADGSDDEAGRRALLTVLGHAVSHFDLLPHADRITRLTGCPVPPAAGSGDDKPWRPVEVIAHDRPCDGLAILTVRPWHRLHWRPGQAVPVNTPRHPGHWRWYSPANTPRPDGTIELHVHAIGAVSGSLVHEVRPGELLHLGPPRDTNLHLRGGDLLLVAGGTGLAPLRALVEQTAAAAEHGQAAPGQRHATTGHEQQQDAAAAEQPHATTAPGQRQVTLIVGARTFADLYDAVTLDRLQCAHDWLTLVPALSHDLSAEPAERGDALTLALHHYRPHHRVYVCGPPAMVAHARRWLPIAGVPADRVHLPVMP
ncbi:FAD-binding oxidoreductase [Micromonospora coxensis]|uniref:FAD-binding oxidoreductase n=1 Tax=Micromonospora coxensis TaxID=356852 RepID=UPI003423F7BE